MSILHLSIRDRVLVPYVRAALARVGATLKARAVGASLAAICHLSAFRLGTVGALLIASGVASCPAGNAQTAQFSGAVRTLAQGCSGEYCSTGFSSPNGVAVDTYGNVYVADTGNGVLKEILAYDFSIPVSPTINNLGRELVFSPFGVASPFPGTVYVAGNGGVEEMLPTAGPSLGNGFIDPFGVAADLYGDVFVADTSNSAVKEIVGAGFVSQTIKILGSGFSSPFGVAVDGSGNVYVADYGNNAVKEIVAVGGVIPASPTILTLGSGFSKPTGVAVDGSGNVYVADYGNNAVKEIVAVGGVIPASPTINTLGTGFDEARGVSVDGSGNVYVADTGNSAIKEILAAGGNIGALNVGSTTANPMTLNFTFRTAAALGSTAVLTQGAKGLDFADAGTGTCVAGTAYTAGETCTLNVNFSPKAVGARNGAVELLDGSGNVLAMGYIQGTGVEPQVGFRYTYGSAATPIAISSVDITYSDSLMFDTAGDLFIADALDASSNLGNGSVVEFPASGSGFGSPIVLASGLPNPQGVGMDGAGNIFVLSNSDGSSDPDTGGITEYVKTSSGYAAPLTLISELSYPNGFGIDGKGNLFFATNYDANNDANSGSVVELPRTSAGYASPVTLASGLSYPSDLALDEAGNVFVAIWSDFKGDANSGTVLELYSTSNGYSPPMTIASGLNASGIGVDPGGTVFVVSIADIASFDAGISDPNSGILFEIPATTSGYGAPIILASAINYPTKAIVDSAGNILVTTWFQNVYELPRHTAPSLAFASTPAGSASSDSPRTVVVENIGNAALSFPVPASGDNPSTATGFTLNSSGAGDCPLVTTSSSTAGALAAGASCLLPISFMPSETGSISGSLVLTDNALNAAAPNYATQTVGLAGTATQATQTIQFTAPASPVTYGVSPIALAATASSGIAVKFSVTGPATVTGNTLKIEGAGAVVVTASQGGNSNFQAAAAVQRTITVKAAVLTVTAKNASRVYGKANPSFTDTITGFVDGDTEAKAVTGAASLTTAATAKSAVGSYAIKAATVTLGAKNYTFKFVAGTLTITKAPLTVTANNAKAIYDQALPKLGYTATGFLNGDTKAVLSGTPVESTKAVKGSVPGTYTITIAAGTLKATNYSFVFKDGTLTVTPIGPAAKPVLKPGTGTYSSTQKVAITDVVPGAAIYYTIGTATPTAKSTRYKGAITVSATETVKAIAVATGYTDSAVATATYTIK